VHALPQVGSWERLWEVERDAALLSDGRALRTHGETFNGTHVRADLTPPQVQALRVRHGRAHHDSLLQLSV
jgi:hypothetical protein